MKYIISIFTFLLFNTICFADYNSFMGKHAISAIVYDNTKAKSKLIVEFFFNNTGNILTSINFEDSDISCTIYSYDDDNNCTGITTYNKYGIIVQSKISNYENGKQIPMTTFGLLWFCGHKSKFVKCKFDKYGNALEANRFNENTGLLEESYKIIYTYR